MICVHCYGTARDGFLTCDSCKESEPVNCARCPDCNGYGQTQPENDPVECNRCAGQGYTRLPSTIRWSNGKLCILDTGAYVQAPGNYPLRFTERNPTNKERIQKAERARRLGLNVAIPEPIWAPAKDVPIGGTKKEISAVLEKARESLWANPCHYSEEWRTERAGYSLAPEAVPEEWITEDGIRVQTSDGRWLFESSLDGSSGSGGLCMVSQAISAGCTNDEVLDWLVGLEAAWDARCARMKEENEDKERAALAKEFGIE